MINDFHIIIVTYNRKYLVENCINSIINQKGVSIHIDVIDNGSNDETRTYLEKISKFKNEKIKIVNYSIKENIDPVLASIKNISKFNGNIINFMGDDDWLDGDRILYEIKQIFNHSKFDCSSVFTLFEKVNLTSGKEKLNFKKNKLEEFQNPLKFTKELNSYEIIYSQILQWRLSWVGKLNKNILDKSNNFYKKIKYHSSASFFSKKQIDLLNLSVKDILSRPFGDIGFIQMFPKGAKALLYEKNGLFIGVPMVRETNFIKNPTKNARLHSYLKLSLKDSHSLKIPLFSIICSNQFIWEVNRLKNEIKVKRGLLFRIYRSNEIIFKKFPLREKIKFIIELWNFNKSNIFHF